MTVQAEPALDNIAKLKRLRRLQRIFALLKPYRGRFYLAVVFLVVGSALGLLYPQAVGFAIDAVTGHIDAGDTARAHAILNWVAMVMAAIMLLQVASIWIRHYLMSWLGEKIVADLRRQVFAKLLELPAQWFHARRSGEIVSRLASDVTRIESVVGSELSMALRNAVTLVGGVAILIAHSPRLTFVMLLVVPPLVLLTMVFGRYIRRLSRSVQDRLADANAHLEEVVGGMPTVQAFVREPHESKVYGGNIEATFLAGLRVARWRAGFMATTSLTGFVGIGIIVWFGGRQVIAQTMTSGELIAFLMYTTAVAGSVATIAGLWGSLQRAVGATDRVFDILDTAPEIRDVLVPTPLPQGKGAIEFRQISFAYPARSDAIVLQNIELKISPGEVLAIVGESGAGKSTLVSLLLRFFEPTSGAVYYEGVDVAQLPLAELRGSVAVVSQEPVLFSGTIAENIAFARPAASQADIVRAAHDAHAHEFISSFAKGYDTQVGERGVQLSVGQKQRIAIARAVLKDPRVLILDEATSNLDSASEALVQDALTRLMRQRTTLVIAHRLSTVRHADRIVALRRGHIVEQGDHAALMQARGFYYRLVSHQLISDATPDKVSAPQTA